MSLNQFGISDGKGIVVTPKNTRDCKVYTEDGAVLNPGDFVKIKDVAGPITVVEKIAAATDNVFGVVAYDSAKKETYGNGEIANIAYDYSIVKMEASAAIAAGTEVMPVVEGSKVATATANNMAIGQACIKATAAGQLIPVMIHKATKVAAAG